MKSPVIDGLTGPEAVSHAVSRGVAAWLPKHHDDHVPWHTLCQVVHELRRPHAMSRGKHLRRRLHAFSVASRAAQERWFLGPLLVYCLG